VTNFLRQIYLQVADLLRDMWTHAEVVETVFTRQMLVESLVAEKRKRPQVPVFNVENLDDLDRPTDELDLDTEPDVGTRLFPHPLTLDARELSVISPSASERLQPIAGDPTLGFPAETMKQGRSQMWKPNDLFSRIARAATIIQKSAGMFSDVH
jgi:hypothetical protein